jgi:mannose-6-phosphate isomerase-like protein (cupin superfamily)
LFAVNSIYAGGRLPKAVEPLNQNVKVVLSSEVAWTHLNPKRGDLAPKAGTLWGDRNGTEPTGFLLKPPSNFESPPHIHNVSYRGVVIEGVIHNDDPNAAEMWMPPGSFWTQPKGEVHITAAEGQTSLAYIEIEKGPYLVLPEAAHFDSGERPVNVDEQNLVWLSASDIKWVDEDGAKVAFLWGETDALNGTFIKLPAGFNGTIDGQGSTFRAVVIKGKLTHQAAAGKSLEAGAAFEATSAAVHQVSAETETTIYVRTDGKYNVVTAK